MSSSAMLTPPESGESPIVGPREGTAFAAINGGDPSYGAAQHNGHVTESWNRHPQSDRSAPRGANLQADGKPSAVALAEQAAAERQITESVAQLVAGFRSGGSEPEKVPQSGTSIPYRGLDYESLRALRSYIYNEEGGARVDEDALLNRLEKIWRELVRADSQKMLENVPVFIARERALLTWIELKRHMAAFERAEKRMLFRDDEMLDG